MSSANCFMLDQSKILSSGHVKGWLADKKLHITAQSRHCLSPPDIPCDFHKKEQF